MVGDFRYKKKYTVDSLCVDGPIRMKRSSESTHVDEPMFFGGISDTFLSVMR